MVPVLEDYDPPAIQWVVGSGRWVTTQHHKDSLGIPVGPLWDSYLLWIRIEFLWIPQVFLRLLMEFLIKPKNSVGHYRIFVRIISPPMRNI